MAAVNLSSKVLNMCTRLQEAVIQLMTALDDLAELRAEKEASGLDFNEAAQLAAIQAAFPYTDGNMWNNVLTSEAAVNAFVKDNFHSTNFDKVRP